MASKRLREQVGEEKQVREFCDHCNKTGFIMDPAPVIIGGFPYGPTAIPCEFCNPNPPRLGE